MSAAIRLRQPNPYPPTLTSTGRLSAALVVGEADALSGLARYREVYRRARQHWSLWMTLRIVVRAYRYGVVLSGPAGEK